MSLVLAFLILVVFGGTAFFLWSTSTGADFERKDKTESPILVKPGQ